MEEPSPPLPSPPSHTLGSSWVTLAEHVKTHSWVLTDLKPGTAYLFLVRSANSQGLSDPSPISDAIRTHGQWCSVTNTETFKQLQ